MPMYFENIILHAKDQANWTKYNFDELNLNLM